MYCGLENDKRERSEDEEEEFEPRKDQKTIINLDDALEWTKWKLILKWASLQDLTNMGMTSKWFNDLIWTRAEFLGRFRFRLTANLFDDERSMKWGSGEDDGVGARLLQLEGVSA